VIAGPKVAVQPDARAASANILPTADAPVIRGTYVMHDPCQGHPREPSFLTLAFSYRFTGHLSLSPMVPPFPSASSLVFTQ
jgi:hypothetical protein